MKKFANRRVLIIFSVLLFVLLLTGFYYLNLFRVNRIYDGNYVRLYGGGEKGREKFVLLEPSCLDNKLSVGLSAEFLGKWVFFPDRLKFCLILEAFKKEKDFLNYNSANQNVNSAAEDQQSKTSFTYDDSQKIDDYVILQKTVYKDNKTIYLLARNFQLSAYNPYCGAPSGKEISGAFYFYTGPENKIEEHWLYPLGDLKFDAEAPDNFFQIEYLPETNLIYFFQHHLCTVRKYYLAQINDFTQYPQIITNMDEPFFAMKLSFQDKYLYTQHYFAGYTADDYYKTNTTYFLNAGRPLKKQVETIGAEDTIYEYYIGPNYAEKKFLFHANNQFKAEFLGDYSNGGMIQITENGDKAIAVMIYPHLLSGRQINEAEKNIFTFTNFKDQTVALRVDQNKYEDLLVSVKASFEVEDEKIFDGKPLLDVYQDWGVSPQSGMIIRDFVISHDSSKVAYSEISEDYFKKYFFQGLNYNIYIKEKNNPEPIPIYNLKDNQFNILSLLIKPVLAGGSVLLPMPLTWSASNNKLILSNFLPLEPGASDGYYVPGFNLSGSEDYHLIYNVAEKGFYILMGNQAFFTSEYEKVALVANNDKSEYDGPGSNNGTLYLYNIEDNRKTIIADKIDTWYSIIVEKSDDNFLHFKANDTEEYKYNFKTGKIEK